MAGAHGPVRLWVRAEEGEQGIRVETNLGAADPCVSEPILIALASHLGYDAAELRKGLAVGNPGDPDPRFPELTTLIRQARENWAAWGDELVELVERLTEEGKLLPLNTSNERALRELLNDHAVRIGVRFAGKVPDGDDDRYRDLVKRGVLQPHERDQSLIDLAYRSGRRLDTLKPAKLERKTAPPLAQVVKQAMRVPLTDEDRSAIDYARTRAGIYMRRPAVNALHEAQRVLTTAEIDPIRAAVAKAVEERKGWKTLARDLRDAVQGNATLTNDMDRVARTELAFAHSYGAYVALKDQTRRAGIKDPEVYKFASPRACAHCQRIWGPMQNPRRYKLSAIEAREADGGNFRLPAAEWGPVIGPVHPNCTESGLQYYHADIVDAIHDAADELIALFGT